MHKILFSFINLLLVSAPCILKAQQVVSTAGKSIQSSTGSLSYTLGEPLYTLQTHTSHELKQGFQQPGINVSVSPQVLLSGPFDPGTGLMHDSLRFYNRIPVTEPYSSTPFNRPVVLEPGSETTTGQVLGVTGNNAIVDWVYLELRSTSNTNSVIATKRALIQRDGDIVSHLDGQSPVSFSRVPNGYYYLSVKHRNHLGVMTADSVFLSDQSTSLDFINQATIAWVKPLTGGTPRRLQGSVYTLWAGDANSNKNAKYNGLANDKDVIATALGGPGFINNTLGNVYRTEDNNMDAKVRYNGVDNDRVVILNSVGVATPNNIVFQHTPN